LTAGPGWLKRHAGLIGLNSLAHERLRRRSLGKASRQGAAGDQQAAQDHKHDQENAWFHNSASF
jgi:hypothetical protein